MLNNNYKNSYRLVFKDILKRSPKGLYDETALPAYTHSYRLMSWLFWKRIDVAFAISGDLRNKSVLDFGCGGGVTLQYLSERNCNITGIDRHSYKLTQEICKRFGIKADIHKELSEITHRKFDHIFALDVFEHIEDLTSVIDSLLELSHDETQIIISGPTESLPYRAGRLLAGFSGHYHVKNIYEIEAELRERNLRNIDLRKIYPPCTLFRVSSWRKTSTLP